MNRNKLSFKSVKLDVDYLTFNIKGTENWKLIERIANYLFKNFDFNVFTLNSPNKKKHKKCFSDKNKFEVGFTFYQRGLPLNNLWDDTQISFCRKNATRFYQLIQQQKINWDIFKHQQNTFSLSRVDLCYFKKTKKIMTNQSFESFLESCQAQIIQKSNIKHVHYDRNEKNFILKVGAKKSPNYYSIYHNNQEIRFKLEIKHTKVQTIQKLLFDSQIEKLEKSLTQYFYLYSKKILVFHPFYTDWMINHFRQKEKPDTAFLLPYFNQNNLSLLEIKKIFGLLQFLSFSVTKPFEKIILGHEQYYLITFPLKDFAKFVGEEEKYNSYCDRYKRQKYIQFFNNLQFIKPLITTFSDQTFQNSVAFPTVEINKINFDWVAQVSMAKNLYLYNHPFYLSKSLIIYKNIYELQIKFQILQNFSVNDLEKKLNVEKLLMRFNTSQKKQSDNKKEIIRQFNQLPIQEKYKLVLKNGQTKMLDKLTSNLIGKTRTISFYEKL